MKHKFNQFMTIYEPSIPGFLDKVLGFSERYRHWRRVRNYDMYENPNFNRIAVFPNWTRRGHWGGFDTRYTRVGDRYFFISLQRHPHIRPQYEVTLSQWKSALATSPHRIKANIPVYEVSWEEIEERYFHELDDAEAYREEIIRNFEARVMESSL